MKSIRDLKSLIGSNFNNIKGWRTNRKIVIIESDDWGSIWMPSKEIYNSLIKLGWSVDKCNFSRNDSLESEHDLSYLIELLLSHKDSQGNHPVFTTNTIVANPDFEKIKDSDFNEYHYEKFTETYNRYPEHAKSFQVLKEGIKSNVFFPQLHGREHTYVKRWMRYLLSNHKEVKLAFNFNMVDVLNTDLLKKGEKNYREALDIENLEEINGQKIILFEAQQLFKSTFGYASESFIAPNYTWSSLIEPHLKDIGVNFIQSSRGQVLPVLERGNKNFIKHYTGEVNDAGQLFLVRNCIFEPSDKVKSDDVDKCLSQINSAFLWKKPAIISSHRFNYIGYINESNRIRGLRLLNDLLIKILKKWPDVEFMTTVQLGKLIANSSNQNQTF